jgi:hypothetical protein
MRLGEKTRLAHVASGSGARHRQKRIETSLCERLDDNAVMNRIQMD